MVLVYNERGRYQLRDLSNFVILVTSWLHVSQNNFIYNLRIKEKTEYKWKWISIRFVIKK